MTKYDFEISAEAIKKTIEYLTNQLWKLIPMREEEEDWRKQLDFVIIEIAGLNEIFMAPSFLQVLAKLEGLKVTETDFETYRKTIFKSISLLQRLGRGIGI